ncbi:hypothetical protein [Salmonirosea aquatica]|uniref:Uncharacterized protein n=1 Tax=Salmonirosea aquatica TaxID=2654236 RepID=A0A7C9FPZ1_9BACT|nr:hypothetical protein [Cytophagaceae bacterium SJW1-29]
MISFDFSFNSSDPFHWLTAILLAAFPVVVFGILWRNKTLTPRRKWLRGGLNLFLWLVLLGYLLQPTWTKTSDSARALLVGAEVPSAMARRWQDSLGLNERFGSQEFLKKKLAAHFDSVTLLGQDFTPDLLAQLTSGTVEWQPYFSENQIQNLAWQGTLRLGEMQRITGSVQSTKKQWAKIKFAGETLDSTQLAEGSNSFSLQFPAFTEGRTATELFVNDKFVDTLRFFVRSRPVLSYQFILDSPDFESRTLAEWLGRQGNAVTVTTAVSKGIQQSTTINGGMAQGTLPDLIVTDPGNASNSLVKKALAAGKSILFIGLTQAESNLTTINRALGTGFSIKRTTSETAAQVAPNLTALPYAFNESLPQLTVPGYPVAVWNKVGKVGVSLLNETFPLKLSGDSVAYARIWNTVLAQVQPPSGSGVLADAPLFKGLAGRFSLNMDAEIPTRFPVGQDTVVLQTSPLNQQVAETNYLFGQSGWIGAGDSAEVFVEDSTSTLFLTRRMAHYIKALRAAGFSAGPPMPNRNVRKKSTIGYGLRCLCSVARRFG